jgi:hypothetical protein
MCGAVNARKRVATHGGDVVYGWRATPVVGLPGWRHREQHAVWRSPEGQLFDVTPDSSVMDYATGEYLVGWSEETEFEPDGSARWDGMNDYGQYLPPKDTPVMRPAAEYLLRRQKSDRSGDYEGGRYWSGKFADALIKTGYVEQYLSHAIP